MKKFLSLFLSVAMLISITAGLDFSAYAADDFADAKTLALNSTAAETGDAYYKIETTENGKLTISFTHTVGEIGFWDISVYQKNDLGSYDLIQNTSVGRHYKDSAYSFITMGTEPSTFYIKVVADYDTVGEKYGLSNTFEKTSGEYETENNNSFDTADVLKLNGKIGGNALENNKADYYKIKTTENGKLTISFTHTVGEIGFWDISVYQKNDLGSYNLIQNTSVGRHYEDSVYSFITMGTEPSVFYIKVVADQDTVGEEYGLSNTFEKTSGEYETENNNSFDTADVLKLNGKIGGNALENNKRDYYRLETDKYGKLTISFTHTVGEIGFWDISVYQKNDLGSYNLIQNTSVGRHYENSTYSFTPIETTPSVFYIKVVADNDTVGEEYAVSNTFMPIHTHSFTNYVSDGNATCTADGTKTAKCDRCDVTDTMADTGSAKGHSFTNYVSDGNATCTADGTKTAKCDGCDVTNTVADEGSALGHDYVATVTEPTCSEKGYTTYVCSRCNDTYVDDYTDAHTHSFTNYVSDGNATCTADGTKTAKCDGCDVTDTVADEGSALGHNYKATVTKPTCTAGGYTTHVCSRCNDKYTDSYTAAAGHTAVTDNAVAATCTQAGLTEGSHCSVCGAVIKAQETVAPSGHSCVTTTEKATMKKNGSIVNKCSVCGAVVSAETIYYPKTVTLSSSAYTYDGKVKKPSVKVTDSSGKVISSSSYTVTYDEGRKDVGRYGVTVTFGGNYSGSKTVYFEIKPKSTSLSGVSAKSKGFKVKWKKQTSQTSGYQIQYSTDKNFKKNNKTVLVNGSSRTSITIIKLKPQKKYYVRIRTYKTVKVNGKSTKVYSTWSKAKSVTIKK